MVRVAAVSRQERRRHPLIDLLIRCFYCVYPYMPTPFAMPLVTTLPCRRDAQPIWLPKSSDTTDPPKPDFCLATVLLLWVSVSSLATIRSVFRSKPIFDFRRRFMFCSCVPPPANQKSNAPIGGPFQGPHKRSFEHKILSIHDSLKIKHLAFAHALNKATKKRNNINGIFAQGLSELEQTCVASWMFTQPLLNLCSDFMLFRSSW